MIEGKIEGNGNVRVSGRFKGNINVKGEFTIEQGASIEGQVNADAVLVGGEVRGQIVASSRVEFRESGVLIGDLKAGSLTGAAGSKMRGKVESGWKEGETRMFSFRIELDVAEQSSPATHPSSHSAGDAAIPDTSLLPSTQTIHQQSRQERDKPPPTS
jgi:cytoskeletal protein CcmA (bactofilin family)